MPATLSIKNVPDPIVKRLRKRATQHHRSLQGELLSIIEESVEQKTFLQQKKYGKKSSGQTKDSP